WARPRMRIAMRRPRCRGPSLKCASWIRNSLGGAAAAAPAGNGAVQEDLDDGSQVRIEVDPCHVLRRSEQQALMQLGADHLQEQRRGAIRVGEGESAAKGLPAKIARHGIVDPRFCAAAHLRRKFGKPMRLRRAYAEESRRIGM